VRLEFAVGKREAEFIAFADDQVPERRREARSVFQFAWRGGDGAGEIHRAAFVHHEVGEEIAFGIVKPDVMAVGSCENFPVHEPDVVPGSVFAIVGEFDRGAAVVRLVRPGKGAFGGAARGEADVAQRFHCGEIEESMLEGSHGTSSYGESPTKLQAPSSKPKINTVHQKPKSGVGWFGV